jgi:hypothetical protein
MEMHGERLLLRLLDITALMTCSLPMQEIWCLFARWDRSIPTLETMVLVACALDCSVVDLLAPPADSQYITLRSDDVQRAKDALAVVHAIIASRKSVRRAHR